MKKKRHLAIDELKGKMDSHADFILVDVLTPQDYKQAHIKGAVNIPLEEIQDKAHQWLNHNIDIIVYSANAQCKGATFAREKMGKLGFRVWILDGGLEAWEKAQYPLEGNPNYKPHMTAEKPLHFDEMPEKAPPRSESEEEEAPAGNTVKKEAPQKQHPAQPPKKKAA